MARRGSLEVLFSALNTKAHREVATETNSLTIPIYLLAPQMLRMAGVLPV